LSVPRALINVAADRARVPAANHDAAAFHAGLDGYEPTPLRDLTQVAGELGLAAVAVKDESNRLGLPAFKVLGASWAVELALRERSDIGTLVAASAGNHGRAVAHVAARRGLRSRIYLPARAARPRREAIEAEGAEVLTVEGSYEDAVARAAADGEEPGCLALADVGDAGPARWVIDGYATLFAEVAAAADFDVILVPAGVGSLAAAAARFGAEQEAKVIAIEPLSAACVTASLASGEPTVVATPGTAMAGLDCAEVSSGAWPSLHAGIHGTLTVSDAEAQAAMRELAAAGLAIGDCGAAPLAALRALATEDACRPLRESVGLAPQSRVLLIATEGPTEPQAYERVLGG
jgi:diaminopropionate ammonia-lyase